MIRKSHYQLLYFIGAVITVLCASVAIWPDLEAQNFSQTFRGKDRVRLSCPIVMHSAETSAARLKLRNPLERRARFSAISFVSANNQATIPEEERQAIYIEPNSSDTLDWTIDESNAVYDYMILARVYVFRSMSVPSQSGTCGVWLLNAGWMARLGVSGQVIYFLVLVVGLALLGIGAMGLNQSGNPFAFVDRATDQPRVGMILTSCILLALMFGLLGVPLAGIGALMLMVLVAVSMFTRA